MKIYSFKEQLEKANLFEKKLIKYFKSLPETVALKDLRKKKLWQNLDIDLLLISLRDGVCNSSTIEMKFDSKMHKTKNFFIEVDGWLHKCKAERILYVDTEAKVGYYIDNKLLKEYMAKYATDYQEREVKTSSFGGFSVKGRLVPCEDIINNLHPVAENLTEVL